MPVRKGFVVPNDPVLVRRAEEISVDKINSSEAKESIDKMLDMALGEQRDASKPLLVGLAAPQIGISKRVILVDVKANGKGIVGDLRVYINPEIIWASEEKTEWYEACYSSAQVCGIVSRPDSIKIRSYNMEGKRVEEEHSGYTARIFQHEIDHLNGIEFVSHIKDADKLHWVEDDEFPQYRNQEEWRDWPNKCPREKWEKIKGITK